MDKKLKRGDYVRINSRNKQHGDKVGLIELVGYSTSAGEIVVAGEKNLRHFIHVPAADVMKLNGD